MRKSCLFYPIFHWNAQCVGDLGDHLHAWLEDQLGLGAVQRAAIGEGVQQPTLGDEGTRPDVAAARPEQVQRDEECWPEHHD